MHTQDHVNPNTSHSTSNFYFHIHLHPCQINLLLLCLLLQSSFPHRQEFFSERNRHQLITAPLSFLSYDAIVALENTQSI